MTKDRRNLSLEVVKLERYELQLVKERQLVRQTGEVEGNEEGELPELWWNATGETHVREIQCSNSIVARPTSDDNPCAHSARVGPIYCKHTRRVRDDVLFVQASELFKICVVRM